MALPPPTVRVFAFKDKRTVRFFDQSVLILDKVVGSILVAV